MQRTDQAVWINNRRASEEFPVWTAGVLSSLIGLCYVHVVVSNQSERLVALQSRP